MEAILYNKNRKVLSVNMENGMITEIGELFDKEALPLCLYTHLDLERINKWLSKRKMPLNREGLKDAKNFFDSSYYENYTHMFSLTDQYWFKTGKNDSWNKLNFFTNTYSSAIGQSLFAPWMVDEKELKKETPDLTTNGVLKKVWVQDPETLTSYLIKAGSKKFVQEPLSEILATMVMQKIQLIPFVEYEICINGMRICSKCKNFVTEDTEFVPAQFVYDLEPRLKSETQFEHLIRMFEGYGLEKPIDFVGKMILCDSIIGNVDRHLGNFGILRDVNTGKPKGFAPLFDFGSAFHEYSTKVKSNEPRFFKEKLPEMKRYYGRISSLKKLSDIDDLFLVIDTYPDLSVEQKKAIKKGIKDRVKPYTMSEETRGGAKSR